MEALEAPEGVQIDPKTLMRIFIRRLWALLKRVGVRRGLSCSILRSGELGESPSRAGSWTAREGASAALAGDELSLLESQDRTTLALL